MLHPDEPFFLCLGDHSAILDQRRRGIPHARQTKYQHRCMAPRLISSPYQERRITEGSQALKTRQHPVAFSLTFRYGARLEFQ